MLDEVRTNTPCELDVAKLELSEIIETTAESTLTETVSESSFLAPFSQLRHLNLAQNKVHCVG